MEHQLQIYYYTDIPASDILFKGRILLVNLSTKPIEQEWEESTQTLLETQTIVCRLICKASLT